jgi:hypothetical protein
MRRHRSRFVDESQWAFRVGEFTLTSRLIEGEFELPRTFARSAREPADDRAAAPEPSRVG